MRWRSGLMGFSLIGAPVLRLECFDPSILKDGEPARHPRSINLAAVLSPHGQKPGRLLPRERVRSMAQLGPRLGRGGGPLRATKLNQQGCCRTADDGDKHLVGARWAAQGIDDCLQGSADTQAMVEVAGVARMPITS